MLLLKHHALRNLAINAFKVISRNSSSANFNYYKILGISDTSTKKEIKTAYYKLSNELHPDKNKSKDKEFHKIKQAYDILINDAKRAEYDRTRIKFAHSTSYNKSNTSNDNEFNYKTDFSDFFKEKPKEDFSKVISNHEIKVNLKFKEAVNGTHKKVTIKIRAACPNCKGTGCSPGTRMTKCPACFGTGNESYSRNSNFFHSLCRNCGGKRYINPDPCEECEGKETTIQKKEVEIPIPPGAQDGQILRIKVLGKEIFFRLSVETSKDFRVHGPDIHTDSVISLSQALLGGTIRVKGLNEIMQVKIPEGTSSHSRIRLQGKGLRRISGTSYGDHYVHIQIALPEILKENDKLVIQAFAETEDLPNGTIAGFNPVPNGNQIIEDPNGSIKSLRDVLEPYNHKDEEEKPENKRKNRGKKMYTIV
ncbi:DNAJA3 [Cordylochernes scorpioides]|uniref:DNAJA3 n=1 Tax=Cordylochernes scorpioides TaxID=51811 RepID=A0ABY6K6S1_9ARAC|nr:DNAJA3 [Cordylochernes scorpioides]